jgi:hypothetical protein
MYRVGDESWTKVVFSKYRPSSLIEAFGSHEKGWLLCIDLLGIHLFYIATFFATTKAGDIWFHCLVMDRRRAAKLVWGIAWTFSCKTLQTEKSSGFRSGEYGGLSTGVQNFAMVSFQNFWWFTRCELAPNPAGRRSCRRDISARSRERHAAAKMPDKRRP